ncbi:uncharacterized protein LOC108916438 [Anoplophora glabripennis]|uniref:uncharacterized protein LOC108916438 n=1 Tax=Anoplophora glabripennis TaxID=217634 RepID=UPI0008741876|nr:uncharacterized protein LOC108916438 [Anoplophora glabripennis]
MLTLIVEDIQKEDTFMRDSISPRNRLEVTLRFLATGMYSTRIHESTISKFIPEVCRAIYNHLKGEYLEIPTTPEAWKTIADNYYQLWQFPNCLGALDGRHIKFCAPISSGSFYYNYKGTNSIVLLGLAGANYKFIYVNVGVNGRVSDGGVFRESKFSKVLQNNNLNFPEDEVLPGNGSEKLPYVIIADDAFPLSTRLSRARRMIESTFGILVNRFRVLRNPICLNVEKFN